MASSKKTSGTTKSASSSKSAKGGSSAKAAPNTGSMIPYGPPIKEALARGDVQEMRKVAALTRKHLKDVQSLLGKLEEAINKQSSK